MKQIVFIISIIIGITPLYSQDILKSFFKYEAKQNNELIRTQLMPETPMTPNLEMYDVNYYSLDFQIFPDLKAIKGSVIIHSTVLSVLDKIELDFINTHEVHGVYLSETPKSQLTYKHQENIIDVQLDKTYLEGQEVKLRVDFTAKARDWTLFFKSYRGSDMIFNWIDKQWFPCKETPGDKVDSTDMRVTVPAEMVVASNGVLKEVIHTDTTSTYYWKNRYPIARYLVSFAAYPYEIHTDWYVRENGDSMEIQMFTVPEMYDQLKELYAKEKEMLAFYESIFGPYPFFEEKYGHAEIVNSASEEFQTITSFSISGLVENTEALVSHELAHSWMGNSVTNQTWNHIWIQEGFATYATALWYEFKQYQDIDLKFIMEYFEYFGSGTPYVENPESDQVYNTFLTYRKPAWVYHMLRHVVGDSIFSRIIKEIISDHAYGNITTEKFMEISKTVSGINLDKFFQQWIFGEYYPEYSYSWTYSEVETGYEIELIIKQEQDGQLFWMPLNIAVNTNTGVEKFVVRDSLETQIFHLEVNDMPHSIDLDPDNWVLNKATDKTGIKEGLTQYEIIRAFPNPFTNSVAMHLNLQTAADIDLRIFNEKGQEMVKLFEAYLPAGSHKFIWNTEGIAPGLYLYRLKKNKKIYSGKLILAE